MRQQRPTKKFHVQSIMVEEGVTGGYAIPHFRNFSALFPQIRRQKLAISAIL